MSMGAVREPHRASREPTLAERRRRELRDVQHPLRPELRIERVMMAPSGVFVVSTAAPSPTTRPSTSPSTSPVTAIGAPGVAPGEVTAAQAAAEVVSALLPPRYRGRVRAVLCRTDDAPVAEDVDGVLVTTLDTLKHVVSFSPVLLSTSEVNEIALRLSSHLEPCPVVPTQRGRRWRRRHTLAALGLVGLPTAAAALAWLELLPPSW